MHTYLYIIYSVIRFSTCIFHSDLLGAKINFIREKRFSITKIPIKETILEWIEFCGYIK